MVEDWETGFSNYMEWESVIVAEREYRYSELTGQVIGCAMRVHSELGNGFQEVIYQRALQIEMADEGLAFSREYEMAVHYKGQEVGRRRVDFLVGDVVSVELKAVTRLENVHLAQAKNYLEAYDLEVGLLLNFGAKSLEVKRLENSKYVRRIV
ncbi:MAG: GxxExxY protein [Caldilineaceae bacterium]|nr:GxxExxY protein [Caldilineaceae bacterium]MDE0338826.1 GxxExxY protein [Caldilineaceae bacterium]